MNHQEKVLIADDSRTMRSLLRAVLEKENFLVVETETGDKALELFVTIKPEIILLDIEMPGKNGYETCQALRKTPEGAHLPIVIVTSLDDPSSIHKAYEVGATDFITKPINWDILGHRVRYIARTGRDYLELQQSKVSLSKAKKELEILNNELELRIEDATKQLRVTLTSLKNTQAQLVSSAKMGLLANLVTGITQNVNAPIDKSNIIIKELSKDFDNLLSAFKTNSLKRQDLEVFLEKGHKEIENMTNNLEQALMILKTFKQISVDQAMESHRPFVLKQYLEEIFFNLKPSFKDINLKVVINCPENLIINTYPGALYRVLTILALNAIVHGFEGKSSGQIILNVASENNDVHLEFSDNGKGITKEHLTKIFDLFYSSKHNEGFSGLGLYIAFNQVTQILGGTIECKSIEGEGTTFLLVFPRTAPV